MSAPGTDNICSVSDYLNRGRYRVPYYQRGYKWSLLPCSSGKTHLEQLLDDLIQAHRIEVADYHLQGMTVKQVGDYFELIDGQQRTTSLYLILLRAGGYQDLLRDRLDYQVREEVKIWLADRLEGKPLHENDSIQDVAAMNRAWDQIGAALKDINDQSAFINFLLHSVKLIVLEIDPGLKPTQVFSMMNKDKAVMTKTDLIKAGLLSEISRLDLDSADPAIEIPVAQRRNQLAHIWDRWRLWWEDDLHADFYGKALSEPKDEPPMARLLRWKLGDEKVDLYSAYDPLLSQNAQAVFDTLQERQEVLQEWYENSQIHNAIGLLLFGGMSDPSAKAKALNELRGLYLGQNKAMFLERAKSVARWSLVSPKPEPNSEAAGAVLQGLSGQDVYHEAGEDAFRQLLRMNIDLLPETVRFPFLELQAARSLEHIHPKSLVITRDGKTYADQAETAQGEIPIHTFGNLVLLSKSDNSASGTKGLDEKRRIIFDRLRRSPLLLHTLRVFAKTNSAGGDSAQWDIDDIIKNHEEFVANFCGCYNILVEEAKV
jgi:hypothetical protein